MSPLTLQNLQLEARLFAGHLSNTRIKALFGTTDGKAIGTHVEQAFINWLAAKYSLERGNAAKGIDLPDMNVDIKVTSINQPQSSCPFRSARQKIFGLGYSLLLFVYAKTDETRTKSAKLEIEHVIFIAANQTADYTLTRSLCDMLERGANEEDLVALMRDRNLPLDEIEASTIARELLERAPEKGFLTISNALQWRLQYGHAIQEAGSTDGLVRL
jgi:hypothetical protein